jgi:hypothetical protein
MQFRTLDMPKRLKYSANLQETNSFDFPFRLKELASKESELKATKQ